MVSPLVWLDALTSADRDRAGAKAWALARLRGAGLPVPDGFVVLADGPAPDAAALEEGCRRLGTVAVRSSSAAEDSAEASFAGQFRTELDVRGAAAVAEAVRRCRDAAADGYAGLLGVAGQPTIIPVLVQRFVEPRQAGVVFTRDPRDPSVLVVESHAGRGEALVSGLVRPRREVLDRETGVRRSADGGSNGAVLAEDELRAIVGLARRAEDLFGAPQDVEWAIGAEGPVLLQSRPITVESEPALDPRIEQLTRANVGEVLPDPVTPLTASMLVAILEYGFEEVLRLAGVGEAGAPPPFLVLHRERLYLNLTRSLAVAARLPGVSVSDAERLILGAGAAAAGPPLHLRLRDVPRLLAMLPRLAGLGRRLPERIARAEEDVRRLRERAAAA
ncbi:MAG TPA: PEP/pyruvate-binding domain-containing protein, partial [Vicinamibacteria bacterium]|nr:PEP/pyruvate-binding domain-containing protein [Vicinamibacteria bacterium]